MNTPNPVPLATGFIFSLFPLAVPDKFPIFAVLIHINQRMQAERSLHFTVQAFFMPVLEQTYSVSVYPHVER